MSPESKSDCMPNKGGSTFDPQHNDQDAKVILISSDNVSFRVHACEFVKGLLAVPSSQRLEDAPIQLNQTAEYVRKLLDFVYATGPVPLDSAKECQALLEMCDHLQMSELRKLLWKLIKARVDVEKPDANAFGLSPWEAFRLGAVMDSPELCSSAAVAFFRYGYEVDDICNQPTAAYEDIPSRYLATLLMDNYKQYGESYKQCSMSTIALRFVEMESETYCTLNVAG